MKQVSLSSNDKPARHTQDQENQNKYLSTVMESSYFVSLITHLHYLQHIQFGEYNC